MKIDNTGSQEKLYQNAVRGDRSEGAKGKEEQVKNNAIFAGNLNLMEDPIAKRREEARKEAMGLIMNQFQIDSDIDDGMEKSCQHVDEIREQNEYATKQIARLEDDMKKMKEEYGLEDGSEELIGIQKEIQHWQKQIAEGNGTSMAENASVRATKQALLKRTYDMTDASRAADKVMESASKDIIGMLKDEALDKMEEDREEEQEKIEEAEEKKEEKEELIEKDKEQEQQEETSKNIITADNDMDKKQLQQEIEEILAKQKLLEEDLKGLAINTSI